jgi:hypothetical protein
MTESHQIFKQFFSPGNNDNSILNVRKCTLYEQCITVAKCNRSWERGGGRGAVATIIVIKLL